MACSKSAPPGTHARQGLRTPEGSSAPRARGDLPPERRAGAKSTTCHFRNTSFRSTPTFARQCICQVHVSQLAHNRLPERRVHSARSRLPFLGARCGLIRHTSEVGATFAAASFCSGFLCSVTFRASYSLSSSQMSLHTICPST